MKVGIIYFKELQWTEKQLVLLFKERDIEIDLIEAGELDLSGIEEYSFLLNRVYASTANENSFNFNDFLKKLKEIEENGIKVINSSFCSMCDYSKYVSAKVMEEKGVLTPKTIKVYSRDEVKKFLLNEGESIIFKPDTGGRGSGIHKIDSVEDISKNLFSKEGTKSQEFIIQPLAKSIVPIDYRVLVCRGEVLCTNSRTLIDGWLGSRSQGSKIKLLKEIPDDLKKIAIDATNAIGAEMNSLDIVQTKEGFSIIENNPTPNFNQEYIDSFGFNPVQILVDQLIKEYIHIHVSR